jgi:hypothetical protein
VGKLTLSIDPSVVKRAKDYAARRGTSVSSLLEGYLDLVSRPPVAGDTPVTPLRDATLLLRLVAQGEADARKGRTVPQANVFKSLRARVAGK